MSAIIPISRDPITVRPAVASDLAFIDALQKKHSKQLGFMSTKTLQGKIELGHVLVAETRRTEDSGLRTESDSLSPQSAALSPLGYAIGNDRYHKHDDIGIIYQLNVVPGRRRSLIGATLVKAMFDRAAYGCRLFCCWCAQDIEANHFWESLGFVPVAFRAGSKDKGPRGSSRVHIFWQRRVHEGDTGEKATPYWYPCQTNAGAIREDRLVFPIPPGTHWSEVRPVVLPGAEQTKQIANRKSKTANEKGAKPAERRGLWFVPPPGTAKRGEKSKKPAREKVKNDPRLVAAARELRDRYLERVNGPGGASVLLPQGRYDIARAVGSTNFVASPASAPLLPAPKAA